MISLPLSRRRSLLGLAVAAALPASSSAHADAACGGGLVTLTIGGLIGEPNRGPLDPERDRLFKNNNLSFQKARSFTASELAGFPQQTVNANIYGREAMLKGAALHDVIAASNPLVTAKTVRLSALDGYAAEITLADAQGQKWVLAMESDGRAFAIGDLGPLYLVRQLGPGEQKTEEESNKWAYAIYYAELMP